MSNYGTMLLSKVIDDNDVQQLARHNVDSTQFKVDADRRAFEFIRTYAEQNGGQAPSYATVLENVPDFFYIAEVSDSYDYLTRKLRNDAGLNEFATLMQSGELQALVNEYKGDVPTLIDKLSEKLDTIKSRTDVRIKIGTDVKADIGEYLAEYERRKAGESFKTWRSKFSHIGEYISGNIYTIYGKSGRGKSIIAMEEAVEAAVQGANVLIWALEMPKFEVLTRIYVALSGRDGLTTVNVGGIDLTAGFNANDVKKGQLGEDFFEAFKTFLEELPTKLKGNITIRAVDELGFHDRSVRQLQSDIMQTEADFVVIDPAYYMDMERNTSGTKGGDAAATSMKLRRLAGAMQVVLIAITQAEEGTEETDEDGNRELVLPQRKDVKKTKQLLEDAALLISVDTDYKQGRGLVGLGKGRDGGEGDVVEIVYVPKVGVVREMESGEASVDQFEF